MSYIRAVFASEVRLDCVPEIFREKLGSMGSVCKKDGTGPYISFSSKEDLAKVLTHLQSFGFAFGNEPAGWPPAAVFEQLRDEGLVHGKIKTVTWRGPGDPVYGEI